MLCITIRTGMILHIVRYFIDIISRDVAQQIVETVKDVSNQNVNFIDDKGIIIASTDKERINTFHEIGYKVVTTGNTIEVSGDDNFYGTKKGINIPVTYNGKIVAVIGISGDIEEVRKYAYLAQKITDLLIREREVDALGSQKKNRLNYVIRCLISNEAVNHDYLTDTLNENKLSENSVCRIVIVQLNTRYNINNLFMIQTAITQAFSQIGATFYRYNYPNEFIMIAESDIIMKNINTLKNLAENYDGLLYVGIGNAVNILKSSTSFNAALTALNSRKHLTSFVMYDDLDFELLLGNISDELKKQYTDKILNKLSDDEIKLLSAYYDNNMSLQLTSSSLFIHKNSLQYKLNKIEDITGYNPRSFKDAVVLYSAIKLGELL